LEAFILKVKVKYFAIFREITNKREEELEVKKGATVKDLLEALAERYGKKFRDLVFNGEAVSDRLLMLVDGVNIYSLNSLETKLSENSTFVILPPVGGGG
jgi:molybdopterin synthase sulfur carrier subunit